MGEVQGYKPPADFEENVKEALVDFNMNDSTELWLIQWPKNQNPDYDGHELSLKLRDDGKLGSFEGTSGREYDLVSYASQESNATVFVSSASGTKIAGKISQRVSLVHYPEPSELNERQMLKSRRKSQISSSMALTNSSQRTPSRSIRTTTTATSSRSTRTTTTATPTRSTRPTTTATPSTSTFQRSSHSNKRHASPGRSHSNGITSSGQDRSTTTTSSGEMSSKKSKEKH